MRAKSAATVQGETAIVGARYAVKAQAAQAQQAKALQQGPMSGTTPPGGVGGPQSTEQPVPSFDNLLPSSGLQPQMAQDQEPQVSLEGMATRVASHLIELDPGQRDAYLGQMKIEMPQLHGLVMGHLSQEPAPMPEHLPPRREIAPM